MNSDVDLIRYSSSKRRDFTAIIVSLEFISTSAARLEGSLPAISKQIPLPGFAIAPRYTHPELCWVPAQPSQDRPRPDPRVSL
jgi:hypothetical protein